MKDDDISVQMTAIQHIWPDFTINLLAVDGYFIRNAGRAGGGSAGGGGSNICCVALPKQWRPGLTVDVRWTVGDWSGKAGLLHTPPSNDPYLNEETTFRAKVAVEKYDAPEHVYIHIFAGGKVRAISSPFSPERKNHPIQDNDPRSSETATLGTKIDEFFSDEEWPQVKRKNDEENMKSRLKDPDLTTFYFTGVKHMGPDFNIADFYVDDYSGNAVERNGQGYDISCVTLPKQWRPGLTVDVRWVVGDWSKENSAQTTVRNYKSIRFERYKAVVPVEKYEDPQLLHVHFFEGGKVRVVSSSYSAGESGHPINGRDPHAIDSATAGKKVDEIFTQEELTKMRLKRDIFRKKY